MSDELLQLSVNSGQALDVLTKGLFDTVSAGIDAAKATEFLGVASRLAIAGVTDVSVATDGLTSAINAYGLSADDANLVASKFFTAQKRGKTTVKDEKSGFAGVSGIVDLAHLKASLSVHHEGSKTESNSNIVFSYGK